MNKLETTMLLLLRFEVKVGAGLYAKYYFHMRNLMTLLGLSSEENTFEKQLDRETANRLKLKEETFNLRKALSPTKPARNKTSLDLSSLSSLLEGTNTRTHSNDVISRASTSVALEQVLHSDHRDADGKYERHISLNDLLYCVFVTFHFQPANANMIIISFSMLLF